MSDSFSDTDVEVLTATDFDERTPYNLKRKGLTAVLFHKPGCPYCVQMKGEWIAVAHQAQFLDVAAFNAVDNVGHMEKIRNDLPALVKTYPTIVIYHNGTPVETYKGERTKKDFLKAFMRVSEDVE